MLSVPSRWQPLRHLLACVGIVSLAGGNPFVCYTLPELQRAGIKPPKEMLPAPAPRPSVLTLRFSLQHTVCGLVCCPPHGGQCKLGGKHFTFGQFR